MKGLNENVILFGVTEIIYKQLMNLVHFKNPFLIRSINRSINLYWAVPLQREVLVYLQ